MYCIGENQTGFPWAPWLGCWPGSLSSARTPTSGTPQGRGPGLRAISGRRASRDCPVTGLPQNVIFLDDIICHFRQGQGTSGTTKLAQDTSRVTHRRAAPGGFRPSGETRHTGPLFASEAPPLALQSQWGHYVCSPVLCDCSFFWRLGVTGCLGPRKRRKTLYPSHPPTIHKNASVTGPGLGLEGRPPLSFLA